VIQQGKGRLFTKESHYLEQERVERLAKQYGLKLDITPSLEKTSEPFGPFEKASGEPKSPEK
jgi:hypothetical protein